MGNPVSTLRTVRKQAEKIKESRKSGTGMTSGKATQIIAPIVDKLQRMLAEWTEQQHQRAIALCTMLTQDNDANMERSAKVRRANKSAVACYKELYSDRQKAARDVTQSAGSGLSRCTLTSATRVI
jgi:hypothetical protein